MKKIKIIAVFLSFIMAVMFIPTSMLKAFADGIKKIDLSEILADTEQPITQIQDENIYEKIENNEIFIEKECVEKRTENSKYFLLDNGMIMRQKYAAPIHYETQDGFKEINNGLILKTDETGEKYYQNAANSFSVRLTESLTANKNISIKRGEYSLSFALNNRTGETMREAKASVKQTENMYAQSTAKLGNISDAYNYSNKQMSEAVQPEIGESKLTYKGVFNDVDFEYSVNSFGIKEDIIVNKLKNNYEFSYTITAPDLNLVMQQDGSIIAYDQMQEAQFEIPAPTMTDGANAFSNEVSYALMQNESGTYTLKIIADKNWINAAERVMPVKIDPAVNVTRQTAKGHTHYLSGSMSDEIDQNKIKFGKYNSTNCEAYMIFPNENRQTYFYGYQLVYGKLKYYVSRKGSGSIGYNIHAVYSEDPISIDNCVNLQTTNLIASETISNSTAAEKNVYFIPESFNDCPDIIFKWSKTSNTENYGEIDVKSGNLPSITEYYISTVGIKEDMPYEEFEYNGGSANVNLLNGALTASFNLLNVSTLKNPMSLQLYYNDGYSDIMSEFGMSEIFGKNMKLNFQQAIDRTNDTVRYVDEDGSIETLRKGNGIYYSTDNNITCLQSSIFVGSNNMLFFDSTVSDRFEGYYVGHTRGIGTAIYKIAYENEKITKIYFYTEGLNTHYVTFTYNSANRVEYATSYITRDSNCNSYQQLGKCKFTYDDSGNLVKITNAHSGNDKYVLKYNEGKLYEVYDFDGNGYQFSRSHWSQQSIIKMAAVTQISKKGTTYEEYYDGDYVTFSANNSSHDYATVTEVSYYNSNYERLGRRFVSRHFFKGMGSEWYVNNKNETVISSSIADFSDDVNNEWFTYQKIKRVAEQKNNVTLSSNSSLAAGASVTGTISANHDIPNKTGASYFISFMLEASKTGYAQVFARGRVICTIHIAGPAKAYYFVPVSYFSQGSAGTFEIRNVGENYISVSSPSYNYISSTQTIRKISKTDPKKNYISQIIKSGYDYSQTANYDYRGQVTSINETDRSGSSAVEKTYTYTYESYPNAEDFVQKKLKSIFDGTKQVLYEYDDEHNTITVIGKDGNLQITKNTTTTTDGFNNYTVVQNENGITTTVYYTVDCGDIRLTKSSTTAGTTTEYSYNYDGQVDAITRGGIVQGISYSNGKVTGYSIGDATDTSKRENYSLIRSSSDPSLITGIKYGGDTYASFGYTDYGDLNTVTYANGASRTYNYNDRKLTGIVLKDSPSATSTTINYGYSGTEINSITQSYGVRTLSYAFSNTKTQSSTTVSGDINANYVYNYDETNGRLLNRTTSLNGSASRTETFNYNSDGLLQSHGDIEHKTAYTYDDYGRLLTKSQNLMSMTNSGIEFVEKQKYQYSYEDHEGDNISDFGYKTNKISEVINSKNNSKQIYNYNGAGNLIYSGYFLNNNLLYGYIYSYDAFGRLTYDGKNSYTYDKYNNLTSKSTGSSVTTFTYSEPIPNSTSSIDYKTKLLSVTDSGTTKYFGYDALGNITVYKGTSATSGSRLYWTRGNMLSSGDLGNNPFSYEYGPDNLRYRKDVSGFTTYYYWDGNRLAGEITGSNITQYLYDASGIIGMKYNSNYYYFEKNILGDILAVYNSNGAIVASFTYDSFGNFTASGSMVNLVKFRYRGYYYDAETGFYYLQNRYYDPTICRFISADKSSLLSTLANSIGELNLYVYCNNNPIMYTDPTGEFPVLATILCVIGVLAGGLFFGTMAYNMGYTGLDLVGISLLGGILGGIIGFSAGSLLAMFIPEIVSFMGSSFSLFNFINSTGSLVSVSVTGTQLVLAVAAVLIGTVGIVYASNERPKNNRTQNKQFSDAAKSLGYDVNDPDVLDDLKTVHKYIRNNRLNLGFKELIKLIKELLG